jgi:hypothetical protein
MATEKIHELCEKFLLYLIDERDENKYIMTTIYEEKWRDEDECNRWVNDILTNYLMNGLDYLFYTPTGYQYIPGRCDIRSWKSVKACEALREIMKEEYISEITTLYKSLENWRMEDDEYYSSIIYNYCYRLVFDKSHTELIEYIKQLYESNIIIPK